MIINRLSEIKNEIERLVEQGDIPEDFEGVFYPKRLGSRVIVEAEGIKKLSDPKARILRSQEPEGQGHVVGYVNDITRERERVGKLLAGDTPFFTAE